MKRMIVWIVCAGFLAGLLLVASALTGDRSGSLRKVYARGDEDRKHAGCTNATLNGTYGFQRMGHTLQGELSAVGIVTFDGQGNGVAAQTISRSGIFNSVTNQLGTYTINSDCTGTETDPNGNVFAHLVIVHGGSEVLGMSLTPGNNVAIHFERLVDPPGHVHVED